MKKIRIKHDMNISGYGIIPAGTAFKVEKFNQRYIYVKMNNSTTLKLARKADCEIVY